MDSLDTFKFNLVGLAPPAERSAGLGRQTAWMFIAVVSLLVVSGCATPIPGARTDLLAFLKEGRTTREEVILTLGQPSGTFEEDGILTYRVGFDASQGYFIISPKEVLPWQLVRYSLVLVFNESGTLRTQRLVDVQ